MGIHGDIKELDATEARNAHSRLVGMAGSKWEESLPKKDLNAYRNDRQKAQNALDAASRADYWQGRRNTPANREIVDRERSAAIEKARAALDAATKALADFEQAHGKQKFIDDWVKQAESPEPSAPSGGKGGDRIGSPDAESPLRPAPKKTYDGKGKMKKPTSDIQAQKPLGEAEVRGEENKPTEISEETKRRFAEKPSTKNWQIKAEPDSIKAIKPTSLAIKSPRSRPPSATTGWRRFPRFRTKSPATARRGNIPTGRRRSMTGFRSCARWRRASGTRRARRRRTNGRTRSWRSSRLVAASSRRSS